jgi:hypothetical protein
MKAKSLQPILLWATLITASLILTSTAQAANQYKVLHYFVETREPDQFRNRLYFWFLTVPEPVARSRQY